MLTLIHVSKEFANEARLGLREGSFSSAVKQKQQFDCSLSVLGIGSTIDIPEHLAV